LTNAGIFFERSRGGGFRENRSRPEKPTNRRVEKFLIRRGETGYKISTFIFNLKTL
jgi:hypothetical protein